MSKEAELLTKLMPGHADLWPIIQDIREKYGIPPINPDEAKVVEYIFDLYVNKGLKGTQIANRLNDEGVPSRGIKWWSSPIYTILKSETYLGMGYMFKHRRVEPTRKNPKATQYRKVKKSSKVTRPREDWIGIPVPRIIDDETWNKAQVLLKQNARASRRNNKKNKYMLRGLVLCGLCGSMASGYVSNKSTYYSCGAKRNKNIHSKPHDEIIQVKHKPFDEKVWAGLTELLHDPENLKVQLERRLQVKRAKRLPAYSTDGFDKELAILETQEERILDAYRQEVISLDDLKEQKEKIAKQRNVIEGKKKAVLSQQKSLGQPQITIDMLGLKAFSACYGESRLHHP